MLDFDTLNINLGLDRMRKILSELDDPQLKFKSVHVAGTNGKGSVCAMLDSILREAGYKVGLFTSPHLFRWEERIRINGKEIESVELRTLSVEIRKKARELKIDLTPFEEITAAAFKHFADCGVDIAAVEVGMGGRLDATNVITPLVSAITNIDLDHTEYLGNTIDKIAYEKAGIIKPKVPVVTAEKKPEALNVIRNICKKNNSQCWVVGEDVPPLYYNKYNVLRDPAKGGTGMNVKSRMLGPHQRENEAAAVKVAELLKVNRSAIEKGLKKTIWPGRFQVISKDPLIIVDGAHNAAGARALSETIRELKIDPPLTLVLGIQSYKNTDEILKILVPLADKIIITQSSHPQAAKPEELASKIDRKQVLLINSVAEALEVALGYDQTTIVTGSLFVAAEAIKRFDA